MHSRQHKSLRGTWKREPDLDRIKSSDKHPNAQILTWTLSKPIQAICAPLINLVVSWEMVFSQGFWCFLLFDRQEIPSEEPFSLEFIIFGTRGNQEAQRQRENENQRGGEGGEGISRRKVHQANRLGLRGISTRGKGLLCRAVVGCASGRATRPTRWCSPGNDIALWLGNAAGWETSLKWEAANAALKRIFLVRIPNQ